MSLIPASLIEKRWHEAVSNLKFGTLDFTTPSGELTTVKGEQPGPRANFKIADWDVLRQTLARGDIGLGEAYIDGSWDTDDIETLVSLFLMNMDGFDRFANGSVLQRIGFLIHNALIRRNTLSGASRNIKDHYDVGNNFYALWLDPSMTYSSALYRDPNANLQQAQQTKYERILSKLPGGKSSILEIGCGWGGFAERATQDGAEDRADRTAFGTGASSGIFAQGASAPARARHPATAGARA